MGARIYGSFSFFLLMDYKSLHQAFRPKSWIYSWELFHRLAFVLVSAHRVWTYSLFKINLQSVFNFDGYSAESVIYQRISLAGTWCKCSSFSISHGMQSSGRNTHTPLSKHFRSKNEIVAGFIASKFGENSVYLVYFAYLVVANVLSYSWINIL